MLKEILESAVGAVGRTGKSDAEFFVKNNPELINKFRKIVSQVGGKAVAVEILNLKLFGKPAPGKDSLESKFTIKKDPALEAKEKW